MILLRARRTAKALVLEITNSNGERFINVELLGGKLENYAN